MRIPSTYIVRNLFARRLTTALTAGGMALVVYVFATVLMLSAGLRATLVATGQDDNVIVIRRGAQTEVQSGVDRAQAGVVESLPDVAAGEDGRALISKEPVVLINLPKRASGKPSNVACSGRGPRKSSPGRRSRPVSGARGRARRCASPRATGPWSACSTQAAPASIRRSGVTPSR